MVVGGCLGDEVEVVSWWIGFGAGLEWGGMMEVVEGGRMWR